MICPTCNSEFKQPSKVISPKIYNCGCSRSDYKAGEYSFYYYTLFGRNHISGLNNPNRKSPFLDINCESICRIDFFLPPIIKDNTFDYKAMEQKLESWLFFNEMFTMF